MQDLREAYRSSKDYRRRLSILTLSPFTLEKTATFFGASLYMARKARQLKETGGVLPETSPAKDDASVRKTREK